MAVIQAGMNKKMMLGITVGVRSSIEHTKSHSNDCSSRAYGRDLGLLMVM